MRKRTENRQMDRVHEQLSVREAHASCALINISREAKCFARLARVLHWILSEKCINARTG